MRVALLLFAGAVSGLLACGESPADVAPFDNDGGAFAVSEGIPLNAVLSFGRDDVGSKFPPPSGHDQSFHAKDKIRPHTVRIRAGGSVTFEMGTFHQVAIYDDGVKPGDIDETITVDLTAPPPAPPGTVIIPDFLIDDTTNRLEVGPFSFAPMSWTSPPGTFDAPGTYLVICRVVPHFVVANMYAFVEVV